MKKSTIAFILSLFFISTLSVAQQISPGEIASLKKWQVNQFNIGLGLDGDNFTAMSLEHILVFAKNPREMYRDLKDFNEEATTQTYGLALYSSVSFSPLNKMTGKYKSNQELQLGIGIHTPKEAMVSYKNEQMDSSIVFCNLHGELTLEAAYLKRHIWNERWHWYWGAGINVGSSFNNEMMLISGQYFEEGEHPSTQQSLENNVETYKAKSVFYSRVYVPYGLHYATSKYWTFGFDLRTGIGMQLIEGEKANFIKKTGTFALGAKYRF